MQKYYLFRYMLVIQFLSVQFQYTGTSFSLNKELISTRDSLIFIHTMASIIALTLAGEIYEQFLPSLGMASIKYIGHGYQNWDNLCLVQACSNLIKGFEF